MEASTVLVLFALLTLAGQQRACAAPDAGGFSVEFIHRDSPRSPFHDPALSPHDRMLAAARRSLQGRGLEAGSSVRDVAPAAAADADGGVDSKIISRSFEYLMAVSIGTPPTQMLAIADTGSDLVWVNCRNGSGAPAAAAAGGAVFAPSRSSTYDVVICQSDACQALNQASCDAASNCQYQYGYGDGSRTVGVLSTETFTFVDGGARQVQVPHVDFGCSTYMAGTFHADGLVGLGAGALSLVSQLGSATSFGRRFSYCLIPSSAGANSSSTLNFGSRAVVSEPGAATTPLVPGEVETYYTVALESVGVGGRAVATHESAIIVDSGTTLTFLAPALLQPLVAELGRRINLTRAQPPEQLLEVCYDVRGRAPEDWGIPDVTLRFGGGGGDVTLRPENTFVMVQEGTLCLALVPVSEAQPMSILGNIAQQNLHVGYDLDARTVTFASADCTRSSAASSSTTAARGQTSRGERNRRRGGFARVDESRLAGGRRGPESEPRFLLGDWEKERAVLIRWGAFAAAFDQASHQDDHSDLDEFHDSRSPPDEIPAVPESPSVTHDIPNSQNASSARRDRGHRQQNPLNSGFWISIELIVNVSQIIAAISVLSVSRNENPHAPLFVWLLGYTIGCIAILPHLYWRYLHRNRQSMEQELPTQSPPERNVSETNSFAVVSSPHASETADGANGTGVSRSNLPMASPRFYALVACFKLALDCFFAVWFVVGNVWIFGSRSSAHDAPNLYRICIVFLAFGFIGYALPFILCTMICCCLPCIISILGVHEDLDLNRGATTDTINALVAYKFKSKRVHDGDVGEDCGGVLAAGTDKERTISAEDAICCICLSKFSNNEDLRELPCTHVFHMECIDKWLQINALCPLCKAEIGGSKGVPESGSGGPQDDNRVGNDVESQR